MEPFISALIVDMKGAFGIPDIPYSLGSDKIRSNFYSGRV